MGLTKIKYLSLKEATEYCDYSSDYLKLRARQRKLRAIKIGRNWVTTKKWLDYYLEEVKAVADRKKTKNSVAKKIAVSPEVLSSGKSPVLHFGLAIALVFALLAAGSAFGKSSFQNALEDVTPLINGLSENFDKGMQSLAGKISSVDLSSVLGKSSFQNVSESVVPSVKGFNENFERGTQLLRESLPSIALPNVRPADIAGNISMEEKVILGEGNATDVSQQIAGSSESGIKKTVGKVKDKVDEAGRNLAEGYNIASGFIKEKLEQGYQAVTDPFVRVFQSAPVFLEESLFREEAAVAENGEEKSAPSQEEISQSEKEILAGEAVQEITRITRIEPIKEIVREVTTIDSEALRAIKLDIEELQEEISKRLYAPGGVISQQIYVTEPVSSPKIYQQDGDIVLQTAGSGNVILSAATGMQISGSQVVIDSTSIQNPLVYIADRTMVAGDVEIGGAAGISGAITAQTITLNAPAGYSGNIIDAQVDSSSVFYVDQAGSIVALGSFNVGTTTINGRLTVDGDILPAITTTYDLGSENYHWQDVYATSLQAVAMDLTIQTATSGGISLISAGALAETFATTSSYSLIHGGITRLAVDSSGNITATGTTIALAGNTALTGTLDVSATSTFAGYVGIATTTSPGFPLTVQGNIWGSGNLVISGTATATNLDISGLSYFGSSDQFKIDSSGNASTSGAFIVGAHFTSNGDMTFGSDSSDDAVFNAVLSSSLIPSVDLSYDLGTSTARWRNIYVGTTTIGETIILGSNEISSNGALNLTGAGTSLWQVSGGALSVQTDSQNLTLQTATSGNLAVTSAGNLTETFAAGSAYSLVHGTTARLAIDSSGNITATGTTIALAGDTALTGTLDISATSTFAGYVGIATTTSPGFPLTVQGNIWGSGNIVLLGTIDTGQGATELYLMDQGVRTTDSPTFANLTITTTATTTNLDVSGWAYFGSADQFQIDSSGNASTTGSFSALSGASNLATTTITGDFTINTDDFYIQQSTGYVSIGTTTPSGLFSVATSTPILHVDINGNVGIGTTGPDRRLDVLDVTNPQLRLTNTDGSIYTDFSVAPSTGDLTVSLYPNTTANDIILNMPGGSTGANLWVCEGTACPNESVADGGNLLIERDIYMLQGSTSTIRSTSSASIVIDAGSGSVVIGDGTGKLTVGTVDPLFHIDGKSYATYGTGMIGVKEEVTGVVQMEYDSERSAFAAVIDFERVEEGSDLWLFSRVISKDMRLISILLTPNMPARVWYEKDAANWRIIFYSDNASEISFRLTAPRFDHEKWPNIPEDQTIKGLIVP